MFGGIFQTIWVSSWFAFHVNICMQIPCTQWLWSLILQEVHISLDPLWISLALCTLNSLKRRWPISGKTTSNTHFQFLQTLVSPMPPSPLGQDILEQQVTSAKCTTTMCCLQLVVLSSLCRVSCKCKCQMHSQPIFGSNYAATLRNLSHSLNTNLDQYNCTAIYSVRKWDITITSFQ